ncbi:hypothetical protein ACFXKI_00975 [Streptomyces mirabilis]|uniref:hypothetical protein n=1 Tax=Streptomyces mirabilis TaxID=68239 RepID=UPI0036827D0D
MTTAAEYRARAEDALIPGDGMRRPNASQIATADVLAKLAISASIDEAAEAGAIVHPAIHHST